MLVAFTPDEVGLPLGEGDSEHKLVIIDGVDHGAPHPEVVQVHVVDGLLLLPGVAVHSNVPPLVVLGSHNHCSTVLTI